MNPSMNILKLSVTMLDDRDPNLNLNPTISSFEERDRFIQQQRQEALDVANGWGDEESLRIHGVSASELADKWSSQSLTINGFNATRVDLEFEIHWFVELPSKVPFHISLGDGEVYVPIIIRLDNIQPIIVPTDTTVEPFDYIVLI